LDKRPSRGQPPPVPFSSPPPPRPPVPTPAELSHRPKPKAGADGESEYEGDYDTDIASGDTHKDALKAVPRSPSIDDTLTDLSNRSPLPPPPASRPVPPPPSQPPARPSLDAPRAVPPPPIPPRVPGPLDDDYDPFNYSSPPPLSRGPSSSSKVGAFSPPIPGLPPPVPTRQPDSEDEEDDLYTVPPPQRPAERAPPPPPQVPPQERSAPPPPPTVAPQSPQMTRQSGDSDRFVPPRRSTDQGRSSLDAGVIARDVDPGQSSKWWTLDNTPPPIFQNRPDLYFEIEESQTKQRGGKVLISKSVYVLFQDFSQTIVTARFDTKSPEDVTFEQHHEQQPHTLRQDQLESYWTKYGSGIAEAINAKQNQTIGDGSPQALVLEMLSPLKGALAPVGTRAFGAPVYANLANASIQQYDEIRPGDIVSFRNARFSGKHGGMMHQKYTTEAGKPDHVGIVVEWDGTKKKIRAIEQGRESKKAKVESFRLGDLRSGEVRVWRVVGREWVGWGEES
jgi:hypothetical protein